MTQIIPDIINIVIEAIFAILGLFFTGVAVPWLIKTGIPWLKDKRLYGIVTVLVKAAEKQREAGALPIPKYDYVVQMLEAKGIKVTAEVKAMIEAAVKELDIAVDSTIGTLGGIFVEDNPGKTDGEKELNNWKLPRAAILIDIAAGDFCAYTPKKCCCTMPILWVS